MAIYLHDPNNFNSNPNLINGAPPYEDMYIYAELTAIQKGRSVLMKSDGGVYNSDKYASNDVSINFIGVNQDQEDPNVGRMTTNWYDGSKKGEVQYEGFGISRIDVKIDSSFIPQVNIEFLDIKGYNFFNQENSPYRILFDFPPPIFELTIKGYYGKAIKYKLHLVKYTTEFKAENGNFVIDAQFVAVTFAPLSDVLFKYIINVPLIDLGVNVNPDTIIEPRTTYELIIKLKKLYSTGKETFDSSTEYAEYQKILKNLGEVESFTNYLEKFASSASLSKLGNVFLGTIDDIPITPLIIDNQITITQLENGLNQYRDYIKSISTTGYPTKISRRLCVLYRIGEYENSQNLTNMFIPNPALFLNENAPVPLNTAKSYFNNYRSELLKRLTFIGLNEGDIPEATEYYPMENNVKQTYIALDITNLFMNVFKYKDNQLKSKEIAAATITAFINKIITDNLGMTPTIYNIFNIILGDVDRFFNYMHKVAGDAEEHHKNFKDAILSAPNYRDTKKIYPYPLVVQQKTISGSDGYVPTTENEEETANRVLAGKIKEERIAPLELSTKLEKPFPEIEFVYDFIDTYLKQGEIIQDLNMKSETNDDGSYKWIPFSPLDSSLGSQDVSSPYLGMNFYSGTQQEFIFQKLLDRFYLISQYSLKENFNTNSNLRTLYAETEALNLALALRSQSVIDNLRIDIQKYIVDITGFYDYLQNTVTNYSFNSKDSVNLSTNINSAIYNDKSDPNFQGLKFDKDTNPIVNIDDSLTGVSVPMKKFFDETVTKKKIKDVYKTTKENLFCIRDLFDKGTKGDLSLNTKFIFTILDSGLDYSTNKAPIKSYQAMFNDVETLGNSAGIFGSVSTTGEKQLNNALKESGNIIDAWATWLANNDNDYMTNVANNSKFESIIILSNFGHTLSPFDKSNVGCTPSKTVFNIPAAVEIPSFLAYYLGALVDITPDTELYSQLKEFCFNMDNDVVTGGNGNLGLFGWRLFADIYDVNNNLSQKDKNQLKAAYDGFYPSSEFNILTTQLHALINEIKNEKNWKKRGLYKDRLQDSDELSYIIRPLITRYFLLNYSDITFSKNNYSNNNYVSLANLDKTINSPNSSFFKAFLNKLNISLIEKQENGKEIEQNRQRLLNDIDIITQTYYSFKNINDKWMSGMGGVAKGFPFNNSKSTNSEQPKLIDLFAFVDRGMNPIGDTILNPEILIDLFDDPTVSLFTVISQLLSINGFEFFPLQNFMYDNEDKNKNNIPDSWEDSFKINVSGEVNESPAFICMYIGGTSSYPTGINKYGYFEDDGITDLSEPPPDMNVGERAIKPEDDPDDRQEYSNPNFPWGQVRAFRVRFGEQNQSMFQSIKIDSKEYPETNESIQILSRLAGDQGASAPIPKGQNLYNLYENRSYKATVSGLGNAMIQPTQYFQVDNVPLYNGAYIILTVNHSIEANFMRTSFEGTKILKYPVPRVTDALSIVDFGGFLTSEERAAIRPNDGSVYLVEPAVLIKYDTVFGIDVSGFNLSNGKTFNPVKAVSKDYSNTFPQTQFMFIKATQGVRFQDGKFNFYMSSIADYEKNDDFKVGFYHFLEPYDANAPKGSKVIFKNQYFNALTGDEVYAEGQKQATFCYNTIKNSQYRKPEFGVALDIENASTTLTSIDWSGFNKELIAQLIQGFIDKMKDYGYNVMIYGSPEFLKNMLIKNFNVPLWVARWITPKQFIEKIDPLSGYNTPWSNWVTWQISKDGASNGLDGLHDINIMKKDFFNNPDKYWRT